MSRRDRLSALMAALQSGGAVRAEDLARDLGVTMRTIYRDMDALRAGGVAITGTRGQGYRATHALTLPPVSLSERELEALYLGLAVIEAGQDADLARAAAALSERLDEALPNDRSRPDDLAAAAAIAPAALGHLPAFRAALRAKQKLRLRWRDEVHLLRPLALRHWGRLWSFVGWSETRADFVEGDVSAVSEVEPQPALFVDEAGRDLAAWEARCAASVR
ncbi:helix-turn-helix transcriptional regulator [Primorskyibacter sp. S187A]|uniref:helix-turn-helix transcriptional regulator n=1 Tax=Primorskyibacter sp. S187A TaxID=3415130 RepID=UPI003C7A440A